MLSCCFPTASTPLDTEQPLLFSQSLPVHEINEYLQKLIRASYAQANQFKINAVQAENCARAALNAAEPDKILARHYIVEKRRCLNKYSQYLSEINNTKMLSDTLLTASRNLEMSRQLSATTVTLGELLKSMPKDAEGIMETLREQTSEVKHYSKIQSDLNEEEDAIKDEMEILLNEPYPSVPATTTTSGIESKNKVEQVGLLL